MAAGGNDGKQTLADAWALDTSDKPYQWRKISDAGEIPAPRSVPPRPQLPSLFTGNALHDNISTSSASESTGNLATV